MFNKYICNRDESEARSLKRQSYLSNFAKIVLSFCVIVFTVTSTYSQVTLTPVVQPSQGDYFENGGVALSWTAGGGISTTLTFSDVMLTQGFQQPGGCFTPKSPGIIFSNYDTICAGYFVTLVVDTPDGTETEWYVDSCLASNFLGFGDSLVVIVDSTVNILARNRVICYVDDTIPLPPIYGPAVYKHIVAIQSSFCDTNSIAYLKFDENSDMAPVYTGDALKFSVPEYTYLPEDSIIFFYHVNALNDNSEIITQTIVDYTQDGYYLLDDLSALVSGSSYKLEFILHNRNRFAFTLIKR